MVIGFGVEKALRRCIGVLLIYLYVNTHALSWLRFVLCVLPPFLSYTTTIHEDARWLRYGTVPSFSETFILAVSLDDHGFSLPLLAFLPLCLFCSAFLFLGRPEGGKVTGAIKRGAYWEDVLGQHAA